MKVALAVAFLCLTWCGVIETAAAQLTSKIIGGTEAKEGEFPFMASLRFPTDHRVASRRGRHFCGGVLIAKNIVLSARHCEPNHKNPEIHIGRYTRTGNENVEVFRTKEIRIHKASKRLSSNVYSYDVALYVLDGNSTIKPIGLRSNERCFRENSRCKIGTVIGWGLTEAENKKSESDVLLKVNVPLVSRSVCDESLPQLKKYGGVTESMVCAGGEVGKDSCTNDSGGPLLVGRSVAGIVSFGIKCGEDYPGIYANVAGVKDWVDEQIKEIEEGPKPKPKPKPSTRRRRGCNYIGGRYFPPGCNRRGK